MRRPLLIALAVSLLFISAIAVFLYFQVDRWLEPRRERTNFVLLGIGGADHTGEDLTDTMIFVSLDHQSGQASTVSLPRDIWVSELSTKLNSVYHYQSFSGVKNVVGQILNQPVNYYVLVDFQSLVGVIDTLGGVAVEVERPFDDYQYPIAGRENDLCDGDPQYRCRYEHLHFDAGWQTMDGSRALQYVRSRHAEGDEGTDFAREARQQRLLAAIKTKLFSPYWLTHPRQAWEIYQVFRASLITDYPTGDYPELFKVFWRAWRSKVSVSGLTVGEEYLYTPTDRRPYANQWVLVFIPGRLEEFQNKLHQLLQ